MVARASLCGSMRVAPAAAALGDRLLEGMGEGGRGGGPLSACHLVSRVSWRAIQGLSTLDSWYQLRFGKLLPVDSLPQNSQVRTGAWACPGLTLG